MISTVWSSGAFLHTSITAWGAFTGTGDGVVEVILKGRPWSSDFSVAFKFSRLVGGLTSSATKSHICRGNPIRGQPQLNRKGEWSRRYIIFAYNYWREAVETRNILNLILCPMIATATCCSMNGGIVTALYSCDHIVMWEGSSKYTRVVV